MQFSSLIAEFQKYMQQRLLDVAMFELRKEEEAELNAVREKYKQRQKEKAAEIAKLVSSLELVQKQEPSGE